MRDFDLLWKRHYKKVFGFCLKRLRRHEAALDATQQVFKNAWVDWQKPDKVILYPGTWLCQIAKNVCLDMIKSRIWNHCSLDAYMEESHNVEPNYTYGDMTENISSVAFTRKLEKSLHPTDWQILRLIAVEDMSYGDTADVLGIPIGTVKSRYHRAKKFARETLTGSAPTVRRRFAVQLREITV